MKKPVPFDFVLSELESLAPYTKPMFGCTAVYVGDKIVFILRQKGNPLPDDGVWVATTGEHHASLKKDFPSIRSIELFGPGPTGWQVLPADADDFEDSVLKACQFVLRNDERIGKIPKSRWKKKSATSSKKKATKLESKRKAKTRKSSEKRKSATARPKPRSKASARKSK